MSPRLRGALYALFALFALAVALVLTFPYDTLARRLEQEVRQRAPGTRLAIGGIGPFLALREVDLEKLDKDGAPVARLTIDRVVVGPSLLDLLRGRPGVKFRAELLLGSVWGTATAGPDGTHVVAVAETLQLDEGKAVESFTGLRLAGGLSGRADLLITPDGQVSQGSIAAGVAGAKVVGGKVAGVSAPPIDLGSPELSLKIEKGEARIETFKTASPDLDFGVTGSASLRPDLSQSIVRGSARLRPTDGFLNKNPTIKAMLGLASMFRKPDGALEVPLSGTLARPVSLPGFGR